LQAETAAKLDALLPSILIARFWVSLSRQGHRKACQKVVQENERGKPNLISWDRRASCSWLLRMSCLTNPVNPYSGWLSGSNCEVVHGLGELRDRHSQTGCSPLAVGIDAPRAPLNSPRPWYWNGPRARWRPCRSSDGGNGRHCEIVIAAHRLANPQWTPCRPPSRMDATWFRLVCLPCRTRVVAKFSVRIVRAAGGGSPLRIGVRLNEFAQGPKDSSMPARLPPRFGSLQGRGCAVGGGDGLGQIILPRPLPKPIEEVLRGRDQVSDTSWKLTV
jgi:hypothetical protein